MIVLATKKVFETFKNGIKTNEDKCSSYLAPFFSLVQVYNHTHLISRALTPVQCDNQIGII